MEKIAQLTSKYISQHQGIKKLLRDDMINYSKLARKIAIEINTKKVDAVIVACRRYALYLRKQKREDSGLDIIKKSKKIINIENNKAQITLNIPEKNLSKVLQIIG